MSASRKKSSVAKVPYVPLDAALKIEEAKGEPDSVPSYSTSSPLNYESALARQKLQDGMAKKSNSLFWLGSFVVVLIFILSVVIYFFLLKFA